MKFNKWTVGLAALGVVSLTSAVRADEAKMSQVQTALSNTTLSGYVDVSAQFNPAGGGGAPLYTYGSSSFAKANGINLNVVDIALDKPEDESPWASGYHVELWLGPDGSALGIGNGLRQAYITLRTPVGNGIDWKVGVFDTIIGYEGSTSGSNPNYSHSFGFNIEPTTHTGILATYKVCDTVSIQAGIADTAYAGFGGYTATPNTALYLPTVMGMITLTAPDNFGWAKGGTFAVGVIDSPGNTGGFTGDGGNGATSLYAGLVIPTPNANLKFGAAFDYLNARDVSGNTWTAALYGTFQATDKLSLNLRAEYLDAGGNEAYFGGTSVNGGEFFTGGGFGVAPGGDQQAQELTATVQYSLWANVLTRLEFRWDHVNHGNGFASAAGSLQQDAFMLAAQAIYTF